MINKEQCGIVRDLMPLVIDDVASKDSQAFVEAHLAECGECKTIMEEMKAEIKIGNMEARDEKFVQLCLKVRRSLSWKRALVVLLLFILTAGLLAGGIGYTQYKMYTDWQEYTPEQYAVAVDKDGLLVFEYASDGRHGYCGYGYGFRGEEGIFYITPHISAWPQIFNPVSASDMDVFTDIRLRDGKLVYMEYTVSDQSVFDEDTGRYAWKVDYDSQEITELRIGTPENYQVAYRVGDTLPNTDPGILGASQPQSNERSVRICCGKR